MEKKCAIIGGGFAGLNAARLLSNGAPKSGFKIDIHEGSMSASQLWAGTMDFLISPAEYSRNLKTYFHEFVKHNPTHPYSHITWENATQGLDEFFEAIQEMTSFKGGNEYANRNVLTMLGTRKPVIGTWCSNFHAFNSLSEDVLCILVNFQEFTNSSMNLIKKSLEERYPSQFALISISLRKIFKEIDPKLSGQIKDGNISLYSLARFFDSHESNTIAKTLSTQILTHLKEEINIHEYGKRIYIFPPLLGKSNTMEIIQRLSDSLDSPCFETLSLFPSIMAQRLQSQLDSKLDGSLITRVKGSTLKDIS